MSFYDDSMMFYDYCMEHDDICNERCKYYMYYQNCRYPCTLSCYLEYMLSKYYIINITTLENMDTESVWDYLDSMCNMSRYEVCSINETYSLGQINHACRLCQINELINSKDIKIVKK